MKKELENYGEVLATGFKKTLLAYETYGDYQGDYIAVLSGENGQIEVYKGGYGSCSGCDWLEDRTGYGSDRGLSDEDIEEYCKDEKPFLVMSKERVGKIGKAEELKAFFPANTRNDYDDWNWEDLKKIMVEAAEK